VPSLVYLRRIPSHRTLLTRGSCRTTRRDSVRDGSDHSQMMDHERTEKELQEFFEEIQSSYDAFAEEAFALQERTLEFARRLLENAAEREAAGTRATLEELAEKSRGERHRFEKLARKCSEAYMRVLEGPVDEHHRKIEGAKSDLEEAGSS
jgi:ketosteroid isomerase-like protein